MSDLKTQVHFIRQSGLFDRDWYLSTYEDVRALNMEPVFHYVKYGAMLGRNPNPIFNTREYARSQVIECNPFYHYLTNCHEAKKRTRRPKILGEFSERTDVMLNIWLQNRESIHDGLTEFALRLRSLGLRVTFLTHSLDFLNNPELDSEFASPILSYHDLYSDCLDASVIDHAWFSEIVDLEIRRLENAERFGEISNIDHVLHIVRSAYSYWKKRFLDAQPSLLLVWGSTTPLSKLFIKLAQELDLTYMVLERGHFPKTLSLELLGQFGSSGANLALNQVSQCIQQKAAQIARLLDWVRSCDEMPYAHKNSAPVSDRLDLGKLKQDKKIVVFLGVNDLGSGIADGGKDSSERHGFLFGSTRDALKHVRGIMQLVDPKSILVFKPHPADRSEYVSDPGSNFFVVTDVNVNDLIGYADVCVSLSTTSLARAVIEGIPTVLLALSDMSMRGFAYECNHLTDIPVMLRAALRKDGFERKRERGYAYIENLFDERLIGLAPEVPTGNHISDFSMFVYRRLKAFTAPDQRRVFLAPEPMLPVAGSLVPKSPNALICSMVKYAPEVEIIIPVYGGAESVRNCLDSVLRSLAGTGVRVTVIFDCSPYPEVLEVLKSYEQNPAIRIFHNPRNLGFAGSVNRALALNDNRDVVILNSDTLVPRGWLDRMRRAAYSRTNIGTVTPFSNNAGIFSNPYPETMELAGLEMVERYDALAQKQNHEVVEVPSGHGFCLYIKRVCIDSVGYLDEQKFGRGYYEEIDFCLRVRRAGFINACATNVYVGHVGGVSFEEEAKELCKTNREIVRKEYPLYFEERRKYASEEGPLSKYKLKISQKNPIN